VKLGATPEVARHPARRAPRAARAAPCGATVAATADHPPYDRAGRDVAGSSAGGGHAPVGPGGGRTGGTSRRANPGSLAPWAGPTQVCIQRARMTLGAGGRRRGAQGDGDVACRSAPAVSSPLPWIVSRGSC